MLSVAVAGTSFSWEKREESLAALFERLVSVTECAYSTNYSQ